MNFDKLSEIVAKEAGVDICPICGTPYHRRHPQQKTCATEECKRLYKNQYLRERRKRLMAEDPEGFRKYRADAQRKSRHKKRNMEIADENYMRMDDYWKRRSARHIETDGIDYGKKQMERTLAMIPKIDVSGFEEKESNKHG